MAVVDTLGTAAVARFRRGEDAATRAPNSRGRPFTVLSGVGRLLEVRVFDACSPEDIASLAVGLNEEAKVLTSPSIIFADYREAPPFSQAVADEWSRCMRAYNGKVIRSAILLRPDNEPFNLQFERVVRCAGSVSRRWFRDAGDLREWLREILTAVELARVDQLLGRPVLGSGF